MTTHVQSVVERSWQLLGTKVQPFGSRVLVVVDTPPRMYKGLLHVPGKYTDFYGGIRGHLAEIHATVLAMGEDVKDLRVGERVAFLRTYFVRWQDIRLEPDLGDKTPVGWIEYKLLLGTVEGDSSAEPPRMPSLAAAL